MFPNLKAEMARYGLTYAKVAEAIGRTPNWVDTRLRGKASINIEEARLIRNTFFPGMDYDYLFASEPINSIHTIKIGSVDERKEKY